MNKSEFITEIAKATGLSKANVGSFYDAQCVVIAESLKRGEEVVLQDILTLVPVRRPARDGRNPSTGAAIKIPAKLSVKVKVSNKIKKAIN